MVIAARSTLPPSDVAKQLRRTIQHLDPRVPIQADGTFADANALFFLPVRAATLALGAFGLVAIALALTGMYGLAAYSVSARLRDIGIRRAIGAQPHMVLRSVLGRTAAVLALTIGGSPATLPLTTPGQNAKVTFAGTASQQATVHITSNTIGWTGVTLRNPDNGSMTSTWWFATNFDLQTQTLPTTGTYTIEVDPSCGSTGSIAVSVTSP